MGARQQLRLASLTFEMPAEFLETQYHTEGPFFFDAVRLETACQTPSVHD